MTIITWCRGRRGLALVTVLWVLVLLSLMGASSTKTTRIEINVTRNIIEGAKAEALADAGKVAGITQGCRGHPIPHGRSIAQEKSRLREGAGN